MDADLVLEGGGVKGIGLVGAYSVLKNEGYEFHRIAGTSAGSIVGALIAAGMSAAELEDTMHKVDYTKFQDGGFFEQHLGRVAAGAHLLFEKGMYKGDYLHSWLDGLLGDLGKRKFGDLKIDDPGGSMAPEQRYKLVVMTSDVTRGELVRLPWHYALYGKDPDEQLVADAVRCSMSIPFFFEPVRFAYQAKDGPQDSYMVDGGMLSNFPIDVFDRTDGHPPRWPTFGLKLSALPGAAQAQHKFEVNGVLTLAKSMLGTMTGFYDQIHINEECVLKRTMFVDTTGVKSIDFHLDPATQQRLYSNGQQAATAFLKTWDFGQYVAQCRN
jgi:NTE family protein